MKKLLSRMPLYPGVSLFCYPILLLAAFLLAQGIKTPVTHMMFWAILLLPPGIIAEMIVIRASLRADMSISDTVCGKRDPVRVCITAANSGPIPLSYVRAEIFCTDPLGNVCARRSFLMSLLPFSVYRPEASVEFDYRGEYSVESDCIIVSDLFRMMYMRVPFRLSETVTVLPGRKALPSGECLSGQLSAETLAQSPICGNDSEFTDNREYRWGDSPKRIHWKLSSKSEELTVRDLSGDSSGGAYILCDMYPPFGCDLPIYTACAEYAAIADLACIDAVTEMAVAAAARELEHGGWAEVSWFEYGERASMRVQTSEDIDSLVLRMSALRPDTTDSQLSRLLLAASPGNMPIVLVSPRFDGDAIDGYAALIADQNAELVVCTDADLLVDGSREAAEYVLAKKRLGDHGLCTHFVSGSLAPLSSTT